MKRLNHEGRYRMMRKAWIFVGLFIVLAAVSAGIVLVVMQIPDVNHQLSPSAARIVVNLTTPLNDTTIPIAQATLIQADALDTQPITALELWVDGNLFSSQSTPKPDLTNWGAFWSWTPSSAGPHVLIVRALDVGKHAVYSDAVNVTASADASISVVANYKTKLGDTLASVARQVGGTSQQIANLNPQLDPNNPIPPGGVINVPMPTWPPNAGNSNPNPPNLPNPAPPPPPQNPPSPPNSPSNLNFWFEQNVAWRFAAANENPPFAPVVAGSVLGCDVQLKYYIEFTDPQVNGFFVYRLDPGSSQFKRIATLGSPPSSGWYSYMDSNVGGTLLYYVASFNAGGESPSNIYTANVTGSGCTSQLLSRLQFNRSVLKIQQPVDKAYCYFSTNATNWSRLPPAPDTFVYPNHGVVDVTQDLQAMAPNFTQNGVTLALECWGWKGGTLNNLGRVTKTFPLTSGSIELGNGDLQFIGDMSWFPAQSGSKGPTRPPTPPPALPDYIAPPNGVMATGSTADCGLHSDPTSCLLIAPLWQAAIQNGQVVLVWSWNPPDRYVDANGQKYAVVTNVDGFNIYENDQFYQHKLVNRTRGGAQDTWQIFALPSVGAQGGNPFAPNQPQCFVVRAFMGNLESADSANTFCVTPGSLPGLSLPNTLTLAPAYLRTVEHSHQGPCFGCLDQTGTGPGAPPTPPDQITVGFSHNSSFSYDTADRGFVLFDLSRLPGQPEKALLKYHLQDGWVGGGGLPTLENPGQSCASELILETTTAWETATDFVPGSYYDETHYLDLPVTGGISIHPPTDFSIDVTSAVKQWWSNPASSDGLEFRGPNEDTGADDDWVCQSIYNNFQLQVTYFPPGPINGPH